MLFRAFKKFYKIDPLTFMEHRKGRIPYLTVAETLPELKVIFPRLVPHIEYNVLFIRTILFAIG